MHSSTRFNGVMRSKRKRWAGRVARVGRKKICMVGCGSKRKSLGGLGCERQYNIKMDFKEM